MNRILSFAVLGSVMMVAACSTVGSPGPGSAANQVQWKEVTRLEGGQFVTYRVPVSQKVNNNVNFHSFDPTAQTAGGTSGASADAQAKPAPESASNAKSTPALLPLVGSSADTPLFGSSPAATGGASPPAKVAAATEPRINEEAETTLGQAEIAVRDAQSRFETAKAALDRARTAAHAGDSFVVIEYARTAITLAHPAH